MPGRLFHQAASATDSRSLQLPPSPSRTSVMVVNAEWGLFPNRTWTCSTSTSTRLIPRGIRRWPSHQLTRSNHRTGAALTAHCLPPQITVAGFPLAVVLSTTCSIPARYSGGPTINGQSSAMLAARRHFGFQTWFWAILKPGQTGWSRPRTGGL